jgi:hypothetical protein
MTWMSKPYRPIPIDDVRLAFPGDVEFLMPDPAEIPREYWEGHRLYPMIREFIFTGVAPRNLSFDARLDFDYNVVARHLRAIQGSFQPKHEHKQATLTLLFDLWFPNLREVQEGPDAEAQP